VAGYVLFHMMNSFRDSLIEEHLFYVEQARKRLLSSFSDMDSEATKAGDEWLARAGRSFNPDRHDPAAFAEQAEEEAIKFYGLLSDMHEQTRLSVVAGMFHQWDKELRDWLAREIGHWHAGENAASVIWGQNFEGVMDLLESIGRTIREKAYYPHLDACHLVVNVYKHGRGASLGRLRKNYPEFVRDLLPGLNRERAHLWSSHKDMRVQDDQIEAISGAIVEFWKDAPERVFDNEIGALPDWLEKAMLRDDAKPRSSMGRRWSPGDM
jgi:hypothetical protein